MGDTAERDAEGSGRGPGAGAGEPARLEAEVLGEIARAAGVEDLRRVERVWLGKDGAVGKLLAAVPGLPAGERKAAGQGANRLKRAIEEGLAARERVLEEERLSALSGGAALDPGLPGAREGRGSLHPVTRVQRELEAIFESMGYQVLDGPEVELDWYNFQALNIPPDHPARETQDTFWCDPEGRLVMRTHTSPVQVRALERLKPPFRAVAPGRVFRAETVDASHEHTFHQMEGLVVGEGVAVGHLIGTMRAFLREVFRSEVEVRLRPGYFPFVEPGFELDVRCPFCRTGCAVCKGSTWVELCPCGMVHPNVLRAGGVDPERWTGFAFGLGLSRLAMLKFGIGDVRLLMGGDVRVVGQF